MSSFSQNYLTISGNLTRDPRSGTNPDSPAVYFTVANSVRRRIDGDWQDHTSYFDVAVYGGQAPWLAGELRKGSGVVVGGEVTITHADKDGTRYTNIEIRAQSVVPLGQRNPAGGIAPSIPDPAPAHASQDDQDDEEDSEDWDWDAAVPIPSTAE